MNLREFLEKRERELVAEVHRVRSALIPLESELAQVRQAKAMIGPQQYVPGDGIARALGGIGRNVGSFAAEAGIGSLANVLKPIGVSGTNFDFLEDAKFTGEDYQAASLYAHLTMKELVVKALQEHFVHGATTKQLLQFFRDVWGRTIERPNLSPQLSRLYQEGAIGRAAGRKEWHLVRKPGIIAGYKPYVILRTGEVNWMHPAQARPDEHLPIVSQEPATLDPDDDEDSPTIKALKEL